VFLWYCSINKLKSAYNKCMEIFFGYNRRYSVTQPLLELGLPSWSTLIANGQSVFVKSLLNCKNKLMSHLHIPGL